MKRPYSCGLTYQPLLLKKIMHSHFSKDPANKKQRSLGQIFPGRSKSTFLPTQHPEGNHKSLLLQGEGSLHHPPVKNRFSEKPSTPKPLRTIVQRAQHPHRHGSLQTLTAYSKFLVGSGSLEKSGTFVTSPAQENPELPSQTLALISW